MLTHTNANDASKKRLPFLSKQNYGRVIRYADSLSLSLWLCACIEIKGICARYGIQCLKIYIMLYIQMYTKQFALFLAKKITRLRFVHI